MIRLYHGRTLRSQDASQRLGLDHHQDRRADGHRPPPHFNKPGVLNERPAEGAPHQPEWVRFRDALQPISRPQDACPEHQDRRWLPWTSTSPRKFWFPNRILTPLGSVFWGRTLKVANAFLGFTNDDTIRVGLLRSNIESRERVFQVYRPVGQ